MDRMQTNLMITRVVRRYGTTSKEALEMRLVVLSYKTGKQRTYEDCVRTYEKLMKKKVRG